MMDLELTPEEFDGLWERLPASRDDATQGRRVGTRYEIRLEPICFWVDQDDYERHQLRRLLHRFSSGWKGVLTEPTLVKLRALLAAPRPPRSAGESRA